MQYEKNKKLLGLLEACGIETEAPMRMHFHWDEHEDEANADMGVPLLDRAFVSDLMTRAEATPEQINTILAVGDHVDAIESLKKFARQYRRMLIHDRNRWDIDGFGVIRPKVLGDDAEIFAVMMLIACVKPAQDNLRARGMDESIFGNIPLHSLKNMITHQKESGSWTLRDFDWPLNFFTCSIYHIDRFLFIPAPFWDDVSFYRNRLTGEVICIDNGGRRFRRDGQYDGINGVYDKKGAFESVYENDGQYVRGNPISPLGYAMPEPITLSLTEWEFILGKGDCTLAFHIPGGPGYDPEHAKSSMEQALEFFGKYHPELKIKAFWSGSWLYDPRLALFLKPDSNIVRMQRQLYTYPSHLSDEMTMHTLFHCNYEDVDLKTVPRNNSLLKGAAEYLETGARFTPQDMVFFADDVPNMGNYPYWTEQYNQKFLEIVDSHLK